MAEWFEEWFGEEYLHLYPHRNEADAERVVGLLIARRSLGGKAGACLDVACGAGRHLAALERAGAISIRLRSLPLAADEGPGGHPPPAGSGRHARASVPDLARWT